MNFFKNFSINTNLSKEQHELSKTFNVDFICDEDGKDWYDCQKSFEPDTWKISINVDGGIVSFSKDASSMFPINTSVVEAKEIPEDLNLQDAWIYEVETSTFKKDELFLAESKRELLIIDVTSKMVPLFQAQEDGDITQAEENHLTKLKAYRTELRGLKLADSQQIDWPVEPQTL